MNHFPVSNHYGRQTVAFDLDGTLTVPTGTEQLGAPVPHMLALVHRLVARGWLVVVHSARPTSHNPQVRAWLTDLLPAPVMAHVEVACGTKPAADVFVDDKGLLLPVDALEERIEMAVRSPFDMWTQGNLMNRPFTAEWLQVHDNPEWTPQPHPDEDRFVVCVPASSGLDSTTALGMAVEAGLPVRPVYVRGDAPYTEHETVAAVRMADRVGAPAPLMLDLPPINWQRLNGYIDLGRNPVYLWRIASWIAESGRWGEVWWGNVGEWQESPVRGGDKSHRFFATYQQVLAAAGLDVRVTNPLAGLRKADLVRWWTVRQRADVPLATFSCFGTGPDHCGECRACFRRWIALSLGGLRAEVEAQYPAGSAGFEKHARAFMDALDTFAGSAIMSPGRIAGVTALLHSAGLV